MTYSDEKVFEVLQFQSIVEEKPHAVQFVMADGDEYWIDREMMGKRDDEKKTVEVVDWYAYRMGWA